MDDVGGEEALVVGAEDSSGNVVVPTVNGKAILGYENPEEAPRAHITIPVAYQSCSGVPSVLPVSVTPHTYLGDLPTSECEFIQTSCSLEGGISGALKIGRYTGIPFVFELGNSDSYIE